MKVLVLSGALSLLGCNDRACLDEAKVVSSGYVSITCWAPAVLSIEHTQGGHDVLKCTCPRSRDGGTP